MKPLGSRMRSSSAPLSRRVSVIGLGKLGLSLAVSLAERGFDVLGIDRDRRIVEAVNAGEPPHFEPGLRAGLRRVAGKSLVAASDAAGAARHGHATFVLVSSYGADGSSYDAGAVVTALRPLARALRDRRVRRHVIVIASTLAPGAMAGRIVPTLERMLGEKTGTRIGLCYNPELVALGATLSGFQRPDLVLIGASDARAGEAVARIQRRLVRNRADIHRMSLASAEIAKLALNAYLAAKISYANLLAQICAGIPGAELDRITAAIGADRRVGARLLRGATSYGGPCFPRDARALQRLAASQGAPPDFMAAVERINRRQTRLLIDSVTAAARRLGTRRVAILGVAYKSGTPSLAASPALPLAAALLARGMKVSVYDRLASGEIKAALGRSVSVAASAEACARSARLAVLMNPERGYASALGRASKDGRKRTIIDCWRVLDAKAFGKTTRIVRLGYAD